MTIPGKPPAPTGLVHHIGIAVGDLEASIEFYRGLFGLVPGPIIVREDIGVRGCFVPVGDTNLELLEGTMRNLLLEPSDVQGADFEIESVRIIPLKEHLSTIPSGPGWHGLSEIYRETIVSRAPERIVIDIDLPERPWLDLAYGTIEDGPITFNVTLTAGGTETALLKRTVTTPQRWSTARLELFEYAGQSVTLSLGLDADNPGMLGYWDLRTAIDGHDVRHAGS